ncbi:hypothetical protein BASA82_000735 [Batrachochytrium salamandrivorans]|nr:hypothetical protein BASA61_002414 [Batrachochytrium salamandrivorans]KAH9262234.1 hypothetical protein BASA82_000735 [Batrachochytrium salamandrivorans]KAH9266984.1 hypothetical protein BASA84_000867 [Batrachochytrium salamandrivorans]KAJ1332767.1 hypothetical protein BSLG_008396 [Batrachochytrium salamandrivorans]
MDHSITDSTHSGTSTTGNTASPNPQSNTASLSTAASPPTVLSMAANGDELDHEEGERTALLAGGLGKVDLDVATRNGTGIHAGSHAFDSNGQQSPTTDAAQYHHHSRRHQVRNWPQFWIFFRTRMRYYVPVVGWLPRYDLLANLQGDIMAGITVAFLIIPQSLSYAQALVQVPPVFGLYSAMIPLITYSLLGTSRQLAVGPEALVSILVGSSVREFTTWRDSVNAGEGGRVNSTLIMSGDASLGDPVVGIHDPMANVQATTLLCLMVGVFTFLLGFFRLGFLDSVLSRALLRGFVLAVAMVVMIDMSETLFGIVPPVGQCISNATEILYPASGGSLFGGSRSLFSTPSPVEETASPIEKLIHTLLNLHQAHALTTALSVGSILFLLLSRRLKRYYKNVTWLQLVPEILVLVLTSIILSQVFRWDCQGVAILNRVLAPEAPPDGVEYVTHPIPSLEKIKYLMLPAILISVIGFVESIVVAKTYASKHRYAVSPNRELVAIGVGNIISSFFGGFPGFGSLGRSAVNDSAGAQTQVAGFITGVIVWCTSVWLLPYFEFLPKAVCSAIIVVAALKLVEIEDIEFILRLHAWGDLGLLLLTFCSTIFVSIEVGTLISVGVSLLLVVKHTTQTRLAILGRTLVVDPVFGTVKTKFRSVHEQSGKIERIEGGIVVRIEEGMFFGNVGQLKDRLKRIEAYGDLSVHPSEEPRRGGGGVLPPHHVAGAATTTTSSVVGTSNSVGVTTPLLSTLNDSHDDSFTAAATACDVQDDDGDNDTIKSVVFDMTAVSDIDATATQIMTEIVHEYHSRGITVCFVKLRQNCKESFMRSGIYHAVGPSHFFAKIRDAISYLEIENRIRDPGVPLNSSGGDAALTLGSGFRDNDGIGMSNRLSGSAPLHLFENDVDGSAVPGDNHGDEHSISIVTDHSRMYSTLSQRSRDRHQGSRRGQYRHDHHGGGGGREEDVMQLFSDSENGHSDMDDDDVLTPTAIRNSTLPRRMSLRSRESG